MAEIFQRGVNAAVRACIVGALLGLEALSWFLYAYYRSDYMTGAHLMHVARRLPSWAA